MRLGDLVRITKGKKPAEIRSTPGPNDTRLLQIEDLRDGAVHRYAPRSQGHPVAEPHDVLLAWDGANAGTSHFGLAGLVGSTLAVLTPRNKSRLHTAYLGYFLKSARSYLRATCKGATVPHIDPTALAALDLPLPTLDEQRRIAATLGRADALHAMRRQALAHIDALAESVFVEMFGEPMNGTRDWPRVRLGDIARIIRGASPRPAGDPRYFGGSIPWLKISDLTATSGRVVTKIRETVTTAGRDRSVLLPAQTLVISNSATVGLPKVIAHEACIHDGFLAFLDLDPRVQQMWLYAALLASRPRLVELAPQGTQKNLNTAIVKNIEFAIPPLDLQRAFDARLAAIESLRCSASESQKRSHELSNSLAIAAFGAVG